ncbi:hypothetical protein [Collimonas humicola]|uniref:hypothetical protein n=1 Tax=Collimonas humicola TaxID=2825886 RepID=UPI001B8CF3D6|nr:hypothetical protein [Collimonas humicola]
MKNSIKIKALIFLVIGISIAGYAWHFTKGQDAADGQQSIQNQSVAVGRSVEDGARLENTVLAGQTGKSNEKPTVAMAKAFYASTDLHAFAESAKNHPEAGGIGYAISALNLCRELRNLPEPGNDGKEDSINYGKRLASYNRIKIRCQGFSDNDFSTDTISELVRRERDDKDILRTVDISFALILGNAGPDRNISSESRKQFFKEISNLQDPGVISVFGREIVTYQTPEGGVGYWLDGHFYPQNSANSPLTDAWELASCSFGMVCDQTNSIIELQCVTKGQCFDNLSDFYKNTTYANNASSFQDLLKYRDRIMTAIQSKSVDAFLKPN